MVPPREQQEIDAELKTFQGGLVSLSMVRPRVDPTASISKDLPTPGSENYPLRRETPPCYPDPCCQNTGRSSEMNRPETPGPSLEFHDV